MQFYLLVKIHTQLGQQRGAGGIYEDMAELDNR